MLRLSSGGRTERRERGQVELSRERRVGGFALFEQQTCDALHFLAQLDQLAFVLFV